jgi:hypothetical protein
MKKEYYILGYFDHRTRTKKLITGDVLTTNNREYGFIKENGEYNITDINTGLKITPHDVHIKSKQAAIDYIKQFQIEVIDLHSLRKMEEQFINTPIYNAQQKMI